jgi:hypothetical protein
MDDNEKINRLFVMANGVRRASETDHAVLLTKDGETGMLGFACDSKDGELSPSECMAEYGGMCLSTFANLFCANIPPESMSEMLAHFETALKQDILQIYESAGLLQSSEGKHVN